MARLSVVFLLFMLIHPIFSDTRTIVNNNQLAIQTDLLEISFRRHNSGAIYLEYLRLVDQEGLIQPPPQEIKTWKINPIWQIQTNQAEAKFNSNNANFLGWDIRQTAIGNRISLNWQYRSNSLDFEIIAYINVPDNNPATLWDISIKSSANRPFAVKKVDYPNVGDIKLSSQFGGDIRIAYPNSFGYEYQKAENAKVFSRYPSSDCQMQFMAYYNSSSGDGLYFCARDTLGYQKILSNHLGNEAIPFARASFTHLPGPELHSLWQSPYETEVRPYSGSWYEAAKFYRAWITATAPYIIKNRDRGLKWLYETDFWFQAGPQTDTTSNFTNSTDLNLIRRITESFQAKTAVHLYNWHRYPFDDRYPDYFPARRGLENFLENMRQAEIHVVPYVNGRIADERIVENNPVFQKAFCRYNNDDPGYLTTEFNNNKFITMCPATTVWQNTIADISNILVNNFGFDGVYLDQVCNNGSEKCADTNHGHLPDYIEKESFSYGTHAISGYRKMLGKMQTLKTADRDIMFFSEDAAEPWNNFFDAFLMVNSHSTFPGEDFRMIPLYPAVYSGYTTTIGFQYVQMKPQDWLPVLVAKLGRGFVWGSQIGWIRPTQLQSDDILREYVLNLIRGRRQIHNYISFGEMKQMPRFVSPLSKVFIDEVVRTGATSYKRVSFPLDPILTSMWVSEEGNAAILATNITAESFKDDNVRVVVDLSDTQLRPGNYRLLQQGQFSGTITIQSNQVILPMDLDGYETRVLELLKIE